MRFPVGTTLKLPVEFYDSEGEPLVLDEAPTIKITDSDHSVADFDVDVSAVGPGKYLATAVVPTGTALGWYQGLWSAFVDEDAISSTVNFEIVPPNYVVVTAPETQLRRKLNDELADVSVDTGAFFTNDEVHSLLAMHDGNVTGAAFEGWTIRAAHYATLVDVSEGGSDRKLSQKFKQAKEMVDLYGGLMGGISVARMETIGRIVGKVASLRRDPIDALGVHFVQRIGANVDRAVLVNSYGSFRAITPGW